MGSTNLTMQRRVMRPGAHKSEEDDVAVEEPLEIRVDDQTIAILMRTPGHDLELAAGFLYTEGVLDGADDLVGLHHPTPLGERSPNVVTARLAAGVPAHRDALRNATRELYANSACGVCGKVAIDRVQLMAKAREPDWHIDEQLVGQLPQRMLQDQVGFRASGGLHAAALFDADGALEVIREDVGRHNAVDKVLGWRLRQDRVPVHDRVLVVSSRAGFEIIQKAVVAQVAGVVAVGAATTLAVDLARSAGLPLYGFVRGDRWTRYCP